VELAPRVVRQPAPGVVVVQLGRGLLAPVGTGLPWEGRAVETEVPGMLLGHSQAPPPVGEQGPGHVRLTHVDHGQDEQLVPEDVAAVALTVQTAGGDACVPQGQVGGQGLGRVEQVGAHCELGGHVLGGVLRGLQGDLVAVPQPGPLDLVRGQQLTHPERRAVQLGERSLAGGTDRGVAARDHRGRAVHEHGVVRVDLHRVAAELDPAGAHLAALAHGGFGLDARALGHRDLDFGLGGAHEGQQGLVLVRQGRGLE